MPSHNRQARPRPRSRRQVQSRRAQRTQNKQVHITCRERQRSTSRLRGNTTHRRRKQHQRNTIHYKPRKPQLPSRRKVQALRGKYNRLRRGRRNTYQTTYRPEHRGRHRRSSRTFLVRPRRSRTQYLHTTYNTSFQQVPSRPVQESTCHRRRTFRRLSSIQVRQRTRLHHRHRGQELPRSTRRQANIQQLPTLVRNNKHSRKQRHTTISCQVHKRNTPWKERRKQANMQR